MLERVPDLTLVLAAAAVLLVIDNDFEEMEEVPPKSIDDSESVMRRWGE